MNELAQRDPCQHLMEVTRSIDGREDAVLSSDSEIHYRREAREEAQEPGSKRRDRHALSIGARERRVAA